MPVDVEFYGIPRQRAGVARSTCEAATLGELLSVLQRRFPAFAAACLEGPRLRQGYVANINGERFVGDPSTPLGPHDAVLIFSADAGG